MNKEEKIKMFLSLKDFDEYLENFEIFQSLPANTDIFEKEMELMETDGKYTHRKKDSLRQAKKRTLISELKKQIERLREEILDKGIWKEIEEDEPDVIVVYQYPKGKNGDVDNVIARSVGNIEQVDEETFSVRLDATNCDTIELLCFLTRSLPSHYDYENIDNDPPAKYLQKYHRIFQIEMLMGRMNALDPREYRNLKSIEDAVLRVVLQEYHGQIARSRDRLYEELIIDHATNARWISEQEAYVIVHEKYPDAIFQYDPKWLKGQRIDIFIPSRNTAIEYQGEQHSSPIAFFGGEIGLADTKRRDQRKKLLCKQQGVKLLYWNYDEPLTREYFMENIETKINEGNG